MDIALILTAGALFLGAACVFIAVMRRDAPSAPAEHAPRSRHLPVVHDKAMKCSTCEHFDLEAGQMRMRKQGVFSTMVAPFVSPSEYDSRVTSVAPNAEGILENAAEHKPAVPEQCTWTRFGLCLKHNDCLWEGTTAANRAANMPDYLTDGEDCYEPRMDA